MSGQFLRSQRYGNGGIHALGCTKSVNDKKGTLGHFQLKPHILKEACASSKLACEAWKPSAVVDRLLQQILVLWYGI